MKALSGGEVEGGEGKRRKTDNAKKIREQDSYDKENNCSSELRNKSV